MTTKTTKPEYLTLAQVAERYQISRNTAQRWKDSGVLPQPMRVTRVLRWRISTLDEWDAAGNPKPIPQKRKARSRSRNA